MAGAAGTSTQAVALKRELAENPYAYEFYQALRLLDALHPELPPLGTAQRPQQEALHLGVEPTLAFPTSTISSYTPGSGGRKDLLEVRFLVCLAPAGRCRCI